MTRGCVDCQGSGASKRGCGCRVCDRCLNGDHAQTCPESVRLRAMTPADVKAWKAANEPEERMTTELVDALNALQEIELAWQSRRRGGVRANDAARAVADVTAIARGGRHVEVELKGSHKNDCPCRSCAAQRERGERIRAAGGVYVDGVRNVQQAVDAVRMGLARARARPEEGLAAGRLHTPARCTPRPPQERFTLHGIPIVVDPTLKESEVRFDYGEPPGSRAVRDAQELQAFDPERRWFENWGPLPSVPPPPKVEGRFVGMDLARDSIKPRQDELVTCACGSCNVVKRLGVFADGKSVHTYDRCVIAR